MEKRKEKPIYKKIWFWVLIVFALIVVIGNSRGEKAESGAAADLGFDVTFSDEFRNDVTGNWRKALVATDEPIEDYALDYYREYFKSDDEVHVIYNFSLNTANNLIVKNGVLSVSVFDYVEKEEHDARLACSGTHLAEYHINIATGQVEEVPLTAE